MHRFMCIFYEARLSFKMFIQPCQVLSLTGFILNQVFFSSQKLTAFFFFLCVFLEYYIFPLLCYIILQLVLCIFTALRDLTIDFMTYFNIVSNNFSIPKVILNALACWLCWGGGGANRFLFLKGAFQQMIVFMVHCWTFLVKLVCLPVEI